MSADILALLARGTLAASAAILVILTLRRPLRAAFGAQLAYAFWLLVPLALVGAFLPARRVFVDAPDQSAAAAPVHLVDTRIDNAAPLVSADAAPVLHLFDLTPWLLALWIAGVGFAVATQIAGQRRFLRHAAGDGPAVVGILRPRIVLPADFEQRFTPAERDLVLAHERAHLAAYDAQINAIAALLQCLNWFNPLFYIARGAFRVDQELACDARVMARHASSRRLYAEVMLKTTLSTHVAPLGCQWPPIGAGPLKQRIAMLARPLPNTTRRGAGAVLCALATVAAGAGAWVAQPPRVAYAAERPASGLSRSLGARLVEALNEGDLIEARMLVAAGADVNFFAPGDGTPLVVAARVGNLEFVRHLVEHGADVNQAAPGDANPLIMAAARGHMEVVGFLVEHGADVNAYVRADETPLINAASNNRLEVAAYLIARGADVNLAVEAPTVRGLEIRSPLGEARRRGYAQMTALLIDHGARP